MTSRVDDGYGNAFLFHFEYGCFWGMTLQFHKTLSYVENIQHLQVLASVPGGSIHACEVGLRTAYLRTVPLPSCRVRFVPGSGFETSKLIVLGS